jgi:Tsi6
VVDSLQPDIARSFLRRHLFDASIEEMLGLAEGAVAGRDVTLTDDFARAVVAIERTLERTMPEGTLLAMVEGDANTSLDDATDPGARAWLEAIVVRLRDVLGDVLGDAVDPPPSKVSRSQVAASVDRARAMTDERLAAAPPGSVRTMFTSIRDQLESMRQTLASGANPAVDDINRLTLGVVAVREFEATDLVYCDAVCDAVFGFKKL